MPELPEVETIVRSLQSGGGFGLPAISRTIASVEVLWERSIAQPSAAEFAEQAAGQRIDSVTRRGKFIIFHLNQSKLLVHLRMSGDLRVETLFDEQGLIRPLMAHDRVVITFQDETRLVFNDTRKFGRMWLTATAEEIVGGLGPEPLSEMMNARVLRLMLQRFHRMIKPLLLDQSFMAGLGNIYTDEALFLAGIHPCRSSDSLMEPEAERLMDAIRTVLNEGIRANGASFDWVYRGGQFQNQFRVYQQTGKNCAICDTIIERRLVGQRGTHYCPHCQPLPGGFG